MLPFSGLCECKEDPVPLHRAGAGLTLGVAVTERGGSHVTQPDGAFAAAVDEGVAVVRVELSSRDHLCQLLHVGWFDVHNVWQGESRRPLQSRPRRSLSTPLPLSANLVLPGEQHQPRAPAHTSAGQSPPPSHLLFKQGP